MTKEQKAVVVKDAVERIGKANGLYLASFMGLTVDQANDLRSEFFKIGVDYKVIKNTLLKLALEQIGGYDDVYPYLVGQTGLVIAYDDPITPARVLDKFIKDSKEKLQIKACVIEKQVFDGARLAEVAALPTREDIISSIMFSLDAPVTGIAGAIHQTIAGIVYALDAIEKQKSEAA